jgi:hypothetical protein
MKNNSPRIGIRNLAVVVILLTALALLMVNGRFLAAQFAGVGMAQAGVVSVTALPSETAVPTSLATQTPTAQPTATSTAAATMPTSGDVIVIGYSVEGRPLEVSQFGNGTHHLMVVAGIHGGYEANTVSLADGLMESLKSGEVVIPVDVTLYILHVLNPDGYAKQFGVDGRANANNVDLNRNWDANWQENWYGADCWNQRYLSAGAEPMSEPETQALASFILANHIEALISYHSAGLGIFPGGWWQDQMSMDLAAQLALVSPYLYPPYDADCEYTGQFIDWVASKGIAAVDIELTNHTDTDLGINLGILTVFLDWRSYLPLD